MNTQGAVIGGGAGAVAGGLAGYFTAHALRGGRKSMHQAAYAAGGAILVGALGAFLGGQVQAAPQLPSNPANPNAPGSNAYWNTLTPLQQQTYKSKLYDWATQATTSGTYPSSVQSLSELGVKSVADLDDPGNLALVTDAFQTASGGVGAYAGVIDAAVYKAVTG